MGRTQNSKQAGFTVIELIFVGVVLAIGAVLVYSQFNGLRVANDDVQRKTAINAMYYALEEVYFKQHGFYPAALDAAILPSVDPALFTDPDGFTLGKEMLSKEELQALIDDNEASEDFQKRLISINAGKSPNYHYDATGCDVDAKCKSYTLRADLVNEAQYVKKSLNN
jgi:type II secretory pathway pseudopilin PulG